MPGSGDKVQDRIALEGTRVPVGIGHGLLDHRGNAVRGHADVAQRALRPEPAGKVVEAARGIVGPKRRRATRAMAGGAASAL